jgi:hypothetical protein
VDTAAVIAGVDAGTEQAVVARVGIVDVLAAPARAALIVGAHVAIAGARRAGAGELTGGVATVGFDEVAVIALLTVVRIRVPVTAKRADTRYVQD